ncbi:hypothetical protein [Ottowia thiooxydans]|uniref:hypothetical protein n=1 Tax=Ottowia thiooxydans TaxID=219182 RepID=UPI001B7F84CB|nr:hypothetical protein [Ottowia thiooxydans]
MNKSHFFGLWREHCHGKFPSILNEPRNILSPVEAQKISAYLENCPIWVASPGLEKSKICPSEIAGTLSIKTDGKWAWQDTMAYYVRKLRISPPLEFVSHFNEKNGHWPSESEVDVLLLEFPDFE